MYSDNSVFNDRFAPTADINLEKYSEYYIEAFTFKLNFKGNQTDMILSFPKETRKGWSLPPQDMSYIPEWGK